jgi:ligand-binding SRPBCC domain-containing protein
MTVAEYSVEVDAPPELVWEVTSDPRNLPLWDRHIVAIRVPPEGLEAGVEYRARMGFMGVHAEVPCRILLWEPPWHARVHLGGLLDATVTTSIGALPHGQSVLRHEVDYVFRGPLGRLAAMGVNAVGGAEFALRRGTLAQRHEIERRAAAREP